MLLLSKAKTKINKWEGDKMKTIIYWHRGLIEKGKNYTWKEGYSANGEGGGALYPWMTKKECRQDAKEQRCKAVFKDTRE